MFHVVLYEPEIPPNTGNIIRLCANTGAALHLIEPLGFELEDSKLRRAGLDYHEFARVQRHRCFAEFRSLYPDARLYACSTKGQTRYDTPRYRADDIFLFGPESRGLPADLLASLPADRILRIPMQPHCRSLNLSNAAAVIVYEAWRQLEFATTELRIDGQ